jgi:hypothetical protein
MRVTKFEYALVVGAILVILAMVLVAMFYNPHVAYGEELMGNRGGCGQKASYPGKIVAVGRGQVTVEVPLLDYARFSVYTHRKFPMKSAVIIDGCAAVNSAGKETMTGPFKVSR